MITEIDLLKLNFKASTHYKNLYSLSFPNIRFDIWKDNLHKLYLMGELDYSGIPVKLKDLTHLKQIITDLTYDN